MKINSATGFYRVRFFRNLALLARQIKRRAPTHILVDEKIARAYGKFVRAQAPRGKIFPIRASEDQKTLQKTPQQIETLLRMGIRKNSVLLVIGGGVVQDIGCFIASVLFRGVRWSFVPTTLLAQADSCLGGKSSINLGRHKNQIGTFYPPQEVLLCPEFLRTLPDDQYRSGMGEIIKLLWIRNPQRFLRVQGLRLPHPSRRRNPAQILSLIRRSLQTKREIIERDEFDLGPRKILNFGHTFGHAFESVSRYEIPHGVAVTLGMVAAAFFAEYFFQGPRGLFSRTWALCYPWVHPYQRDLLRTTPREIAQCMLNDKKNRDHRIQLILPDARGKPRLVRPCEKALVCMGLREFLRKINPPKPAGMPTP